MTDPALIEAVARAIARVSVYEGYNAETKEREWQRNSGIYRSQAKAALAAHDAWLHAAGMAVVPVEATPAMKDAGLWALMAGSSRVRPGDVYRAMLAATGEK